MLVFIGWVISYANEWEDYSSYFGEVVEISRSWATAHFLVFWWYLGTVMVPLGVLFSLLVCYNECILRIRSSQVESSAILIH